MNVKTSYHDMMHTIRTLAKNQDHFSYNDAMNVFNNLIWRVYANTDSIDSFDDCIMIFDRFIKTGKVEFI